MSGNNNVVQKRKRMKFDRLAILTDVDFFGILVG